MRNEAGRGEAPFGRDTGQGLGRVRSPEDSKEGVGEEMCVRTESGTGRCLRAEGIGGLGCRGLASSWGLGGTPEE